MKVTKVNLSKRRKVMVSFVIRYNHSELYGIYFGDRWLLIGKNFNF